MDNIPSGKKILYIAEYADTSGVANLEGELAALGGDPVAILLDQQFLENNSVEKNGTMKVSYNDLRVHLQSRNYEKLFFFSFSPRITQILDGSNTSSTDIIFRSSPSFQYQSYDDLNRPYFMQEVMPSESDLTIIKSLNRSLLNYSSQKNITWLFSSSSEKSSLEGYISQPLSATSIITSVVKTPDTSGHLQSKDNLLNICLINDFSNIRSNSVDINVKTILELSTYPFFDQLHFSIYGTGPQMDYDALLDPIKSFSNITFHQYIPSNKQLSSIFSKNDLILCADRFNLNSRLAIEAAVAGCLPITSLGSYLGAISTNIKPLLSPSEDFYSMAKAIARLFKSPADLKKSQQLISKEVLNANKQNLALYRKAITASNAVQSYSYSDKSNQPILSVIVPSYNVQPFLRNTILSLVNHPLSHKIEVIIVNDGSKDDTAKIADSLVKLTKTKTGSIVTHINKVNGGHGSTINAGIAAANGKYFRLLDGDDYVFTDNFIKLIEILENEDSDIVLTDLVEDYGASAEMVFKDYYKALIPGQKRNLDFMHLNGYGFGEWGPLLSTTNVKTDILKKSNFKIDENCFYVDMEYNFIIYSLSKTVTYYPLTIYSYYLGRVGQSMSKDSLRRNVLHHEKVTLRLLQEYEERKDSLSEGKRIYLENKMIIPMCKTQYYIATEMFDKGDKFLSFDTKFKKYPQFYNNSEIAGKIVRLHRRSKGKTIKFDQPIKAIKSKFRRA